MTNEEAEEIMREVIGDEDNKKFVIGVDLAGNDGDKSVVTFKVVKDREEPEPGEGEFVWADGLKLSPEERMAKIAADSSRPLVPTHELTDEQLDAEMCAAGIDSDRKQEVLDEIKLRAMRKGMEKVNEELGAELDEAERADLRKMVKWQRAANRAEKEGKRMEDEAMDKDSLRAKFMSEKVQSDILSGRRRWDDKNKVFTAIAREAMKAKKGFGGNF